MRRGSEPTFFAWERNSRDLQRSRARAADIEHQGFGLLIAIRPQVDGAGS
jgi:hypothetical protein